MLLRRIPMLPAPSPSPAANGSRASSAAQAGAIWAYGSDFELNLSTTQPYLALMLGGDLDFNLWRRLGLVVSVATAVPIVRPTFQVEVVDGPPRTYEFAPIGAIAGLGLRVRLR